jgi:hypothetical protein
LGIGDHHIERVFLKTVPDMASEKTVVFGIGATTANVSTPMNEFDGRDEPRIQGMECTWVIVYPREANWSRVELYPFNGVAVVALRVRHKNRQQNERAD